MKKARVMVGVTMALVLIICVQAKADTFSTGTNQFAIDFVPISSSTNPTSGYGIVDYDYRIGKFEITNYQWAKFKLCCQPCRQNDR